jgi:hypothetical protein
MHPKHGTNCGPGAYCCVQGGVAVQRGLANVQSELSDTPTLCFKSDNAFLTAGEVARRTAAQVELKGALVMQIEEKKRRKKAEVAAENARDNAELVCLPPFWC